jgi:nucleoside 2-deoxyribosyltransferase
MNSLPYRPKLYLASPLFNETERERNRFIRDSLIDFFDVFLPQEDGLLLHDLVNKGTPLKVAEKSVYDADTLAMKNADVLLAVLDGACIDDGVAFELGYSKSMNKACIGLQTDMRRQLPTGNNPMIECSCDEIFSDFVLLKKWLHRKYATSNILTISCAQTPPPSLAN